MIKKKSRKPVHYYTGDIECNIPKDRFELYDWEEKGYKNFSLGGIVSHKYNSKVEVFINQHDMWNRIVQLADPKITSRVVVFFHNLKFDAPFFFNPICESGAKPVYLTSGKRIGNNEWGIFFQTGRGSRILWVKIKLAKRASIWLRCSYQILPYSVKKLGEMVGIPKLEDFDYDKKRNYNNISEIPKKDLQYLINDILIVKTALQDLELRQIFGNKIRNKTVSSAIFQEMKAHAVKKQKELELQIEQDPVTNYQWNDDGINFSLGRRGYRGGLTVAHTSKINKFFKNVWYTDKVSAYPSYMVKRLPSFRNSQFCYKENCVHFYKIICPIGNIKKNMPCGIAHKDLIFDKINPKIRRSKDLYPTDIFKYDRQIIVVWEEELNEFKEWYDFKGDFKILKIYHFRFDNEENYIIKDFILNEYKKKVEIKKKLLQNPDDDVLKRLYEVKKARINSTYGQMGMNDTVERKYLEIVGKSRLTPRSRLQYNGKYVWRNQTTTEEIMRKDIFKASYITMKQRVSMIRVIKLNKNIFIYGDTDSIITSEKPLLPENEAFGNDLGKWEEPVLWKFFKVTQPKHYICCNENNKIVVRAGGAKVDEINLRYNKYYKKHNFKCILNNYTESNIRSVNKLVHVWYEWGSALIRLETKDTWTWEHTFGCCRGE